MSTTDDFEKMEREGWSDPAIAQGYADGFARATEEVAARMADMVRAGATTRVLDLCTGQGVVAKALLARGAKVTALDFSEAMIALARTAAPDAQFVQGDAMATGFDDASFEAITIGFGVPHFPDTAKGLHEAARVMTPNGRLAFSIWRGQGAEGAFGWLFDAVGRLGDPAITLPAGPDAHALVKHALAEELLDTAGFQDVTSHDVATEIWIQTPEQLFDVFDRGAVRAASLLKQQSTARRAAIRADLAARVRSEGRAEDGGYVVQTPCVIVSARRSEGAL